MTENETPPDGSEAVAGPAAPRIPPAPPLSVGEYAIAPPSVDLCLPLVNDLPPLQRRWTIAIRFILVIPHFIALFFVGVAAFFVAVFAWFSALFTGTVPDGAADFLTNFIRWYVRVSAYAYLLTDVFPAFDGREDPNYPVEVEFPDRPRLNQLSVLFRIIIAIPAYYVSSVLSGGILVLALPFWIAALVLGRLPDPIYRVAGVAVRYSARTSAFFLMLTSEYPWGWKGDAPLVETPAAIESSAGDLVTRYDFSTVGATQIWLWIVIVIGVIANVRSNNSYKY